MDPDAGYSIVLLEHVSQIHIHTQQTVLLFTIRTDESTKSRKFKQIIIADVSVKQIKKFFYEKSSNLHEPRFAHHHVGFFIRTSSC